MTTAAEPCAAERLAAALKGQIRAGTYRPGEQLPRAADLAQLHEANPADAFKALAVLRLHGYIRRVDGHGQFVADPLPADAGASPRPDRPAATASTESVPA